MNYGTQELVVIPGVHQPYYQVRWCGAPDVLLAVVSVKRSSWSDKGLEINEHRDREGLRLNFYSMPPFLDLCGRHVLWSAVQLHSSQFRFVLIHICESIWSCMYFMPACIIAPNCAEYIMKRMYMWEWSPRGLLIITWCIQCTIVLVLSFVPLQKTHISTITLEYSRRKHQHFSNAAQPLSKDSSSETGQGDVGVSTTYIKSS